MESRPSIEPRYWSSYGWNSSIEAEEEVSHAPTHLPTHPPTQSLIRLCVIYSTQEEEVGEEEEEEKDCSRQERPVSSSPID